MMRNHQNKTLEISRTGLVSCIVRVRLKDLVKFGIIIQRRLQSCLSLHFKNRNDKINNCYGKENEGTNRSQDQ